MICLEVERKKLIKLSMRAYNRQNNSQNKARIKNIGIDIYIWLTYKKALKRKIESKI